jgi:quercetin dioxygenase-like cupin family protein
VARAQLISCVRSRAAFCLFATAKGHVSHASNSAIPPEVGQSPLAIFLSAGFRPFFLSAALWAAVGLPLSVAYLDAAAELPTRFPPTIWHAHEMAFGFGGAVVAGFLLTASPNWTGRMPLQGAPLAGLVALWLLGRIAVLFSRSEPALLAATLDLAFPAVFIFVVVREIATGRNWRNLPIVAALALLFMGNLLTHLEAMEVAETGAIGARMGVATLVMLVALIGGRITPSFTRNWLAKIAPAGDEPAPFARIDAREKLQKISRTLRANEGEWIFMGPGARFKELDRNAALNRWTILFDAEAGAAFPEHEHRQDEEIFMISGDLSFADVELGPGDFHFSPAGSVHAAHRTRAGCRCIIVQAM